MINNRVCSRCVNDKTVKHIRFNEEGLCSHCTCYDAYKPRLKDYATLETMFQNKIRGEGAYDYDAAVGFSGGKDSTYVLYKLVREYGLRVKAYTLDNGFMSKEAKDKIVRLVEEIGVEHEFVVCDNTLLKQTYHDITTRYLSPCIACSFLGYAAMINYASRVNARVGIHGRSSYQMLRGLSDSHDDVFRPFIDAGLSQTPVDLHALYANVIGKIDLLVDKKLADSIRSELLADTQTNGYREFIPYFLYHPYDHREIVSFLETHTSWRVETEAEHFDCLIHHGALYLKNLAARRSHLMPEYSVMINEGILTRAQAEEKLRETVDPVCAKQELKRLCEFADMSYPLLMAKATLYSKRWWQT